MELPYALRTGCDLIAEGVGTADEAATLATLGVQLAQGYLFGRTAPAAARWASATAGACVSSLLTG